MSVRSEQSTATISSVIDKAGSGCTMIVERVLAMTQSDESIMRQKMDD